MFEVIKNKAICSVIVANGEEKWVYSAADDLKSDICRIAGVDLKSAEYLDGEIYICTVDNSACVPQSIKRPTAKEGYCTAVTKNRIYIIGSDDLGAMWGIYDFCKDFLKVPPTYLFDGVYPTTQDKLCVKEQTVYNAPLKPGFRGIFINDEDFLSGFKSGGGTRKVDYIFYNIVIHPDLIKNIVETVLRLKFNLIIPSSFIDIYNPDEERIIKICTDRGLYVSQHHVEPLGVSAWAAENYIKENGLEGEVSFISNQGAMEKVWRHYAKKWAGYKRVIWQLGLRGRADQPVWAMDKSIEDSEKAHGKLISNAVKVQMDIIKEAVGGSFLSSFTLWRESAGLLEKGYLELPENTYVVFSDLAFNLMWSSDFYRIKNSPKYEYGVYYHAGYWPGQHLCEALCVEKMGYCMREAYGRGVSYAIINLGNVREFTCSATCFSEITWTCASDDENKAFYGYFNSIYGERGKEIAELYKEYVKNYAVEPNETLKKICDGYDFHYHVVEDIPFDNFVMHDGYSMWMINDMLWGLDNAVTANVRMRDDSILELSDNFERIALKAEKITGLSKDRERCLKGSLVLFCRTIANVYRALRYSYLMMRGKVEEREKYRALTLKSLENILTVRKNTDLGELNGWYDFDKKWNVPDKIKRISEWQPKANG